MIVTINIFYFIRQRRNRLLMSILINYHINCVLFIKRLVKLQLFVELPNSILECIAKIMIKVIKELLTDRNTEDHFHIA